MFLTELTKPQKDAFLSLSHAIISADGVRSSDEVTMMAQYRQEMGLAAAYELPQKSFDSAVAIFEAADISVKRKVIFELVALAYADHNYANEESQLLNEVCESFKLDSTFLNQSGDCVSRLMQLYDEIGQLVNG